MDSRRISVVAAVATLLALAGRWGPDWLLGQQITRWTGGGEAGPLPLLGSVGQTVSTYLHATRAVELLLPLAVGVALGVWLARRVENDDRRAGLRAVAGGSTAIVAIPVLGALVWSGFDLGGLAMALAISLHLVVAGPVFVTAAAAAGVTLETLGVFGGGADERGDRTAEDDAAPANGQTTS